MSDSDVRSRTIKSKAMNRKEFFKKLGIGVAAIVVAPKILIPSQKAVLTTGGVIPYIANESLRKYPMRYDECYKMPDIYPDLVRKYQHIYDESWMRLYEALEKAKP